MNLVNINSINDNNMGYYTYFGVVSSNDAGLKSEERRKNTRAPRFEKFRKVPVWTENVVNVNSLNNNNMSYYTYFGVMSSDYAGLKSEER